MTSSGPISAYRRYWLPELIILLAAAVGAVLLFELTDLDIHAQQYFYHPGMADPWPVANRPFWSLCYRSAPWVTGSLAVIGAALLGAGILRERSKQLRLYGLFILLAVAVGPGLIINVALKDHWGRPRPRQITQFGGELSYTQPLVPSSAYGKSFPCGHCSVGYLYAAGWWVWRRRRRMLGILSLAAGLAAGTLLGFGRMAGGAHFLSDAVWSGLIAYGSAHVLYYYLLRIPAREDSRIALYPSIERNPRLRKAAVAGSLLLGLGIIAGGVLANPIDKNLSAAVRLDEFPVRPERIEIVAEALDLDLELMDGVKEVIQCTGSLHGFGLPTNDIEAGWTFVGQPVPTARYRIFMKGLYTDIDGQAHISIPVNGLHTVVVRLHRGDIHVTDTTGRTAASLPSLELLTGQGRIVRQERHKR